MPVRQQFKFTPPAGVAWITFDQWLSSLPESEQQEYRAAQHRQLTIRQQYIDSGLLSLDEPVYGAEEYVWRDAEACQNHKPMDAVWGQYFKRYLSETGVKFESIIIEE